MENVLFKFCVCHRIKDGVELDSVTLRDVFCPCEGLRILETPLNLMQSSKIPSQLLCDLSEGCH